MSDNNVNTSCDIFSHRRNLITDYSDAEALAHAEEVGAIPRPSETISEIDETGAFIRQPNSFPQKFGKKENELKAYGDNRYRIYWAYGCNWSNRPVIARDLLGLQNVISDIVVTPSGETNKYGWGFGEQKDHKDPVTGTYFLSQFYKNANKDYKGRATTPTLVDVSEKKAVNNDYHRLSNYIEVQFRAFQPADAPDLYPVKYRKEIDELNDWLFPHVNNGHYRMAFCQSYEAYQIAYDDFFESLDKLEKRLSENRFLFGDYITDSDIRLYVTLVRWETGYYHTNVGPLKKRIADYPNIWGYVKDLFSNPVFKKYTFFPTKEGFNGRIKDKNKTNFRPYAFRIAPLIDYEKLWATDGSRKKLSQDPENIFLRHPKGESVEDYQTEISDSIWNSPSWEDRNPLNGKLSVDASINPLKGLLKNN